MSIMVTAVETRFSVVAEETRTSIQTTVESRNALAIRGRLVADLSGIGNGDTLVWNASTLRFEAGSVTVDLTPYLTTTAASTTYQPIGAYLTASSVATLTNKSGNISQWTNDTGYLTSVTTITGNAGTATALQTARTINGVNFDGTASITVAAAAGTLTGTTLAANVTKVGALSTNGFVKATGADGTLTVDTAAYITGVAWGAITGTLSGQTDLQTALNLALPKAGGTLTGNLLFSTDNTLDIGASGATRPRTVYVGTSVAGPSGSAGTASFSVGATSTGIYSSAPANLDVAITGTNVVNIATSYVAIIPSAAYLSIGGFTTRLYSDAANTLAQRNSTAAQTFNLYNTWTDASNYERLSFNFSTVANRAGIVMQAAGTGSVRNFALYYGNTNSSAVLVGQNSLTLGVNISASPGVNIGGLASFVNTSGTLIGQQITYNAAPTSTSTMVFVPLSITPTINYSNATPGAGSYEAVKIAVIETAVPTGTSYLIRASAGAAGTTDMFTVSNGGYVTVGQSITNTGSTYYLEHTGALRGVFVGSGGAFGFSSLTNASGTRDAFIVRDGAANTIALRNSTNAQTFNIYNTWTDASNYERFGLTWSGNTLTLGVTAAGTGSGSRDMKLETAGSLVIQENTQLGALRLGKAGTSSSAGTRVTVTNSAVATATSGTVTAMAITQGFAPTATSTLLGVSLHIAPTVNYSAGTPGAGSYEAVKIAVTETAVPTGTSYLIRATAGAGGVTARWALDNLGNTSQVGYAEITERTAPSAPATNSVRIYVEDNGAGKTRIMALFPTGVAQQIAIEP